MAGTARLAGAALCAAALTGHASAPLAGPASAGPPADRPPAAGHDRVPPPRATTRAAHPGDSHAGRPAAPAGDAPRHRPASPAPPPGPRAAPPALSRYWVTLGVNGGGLEWPPVYVTYLNCDPAVPPVAPRAACAKLGAVRGDIGLLPVPANLVCPEDYDPSRAWVMGRWGGRPVSGERVFGNPCRMYAIMKDIVPARELPLPRPAGG
ncbi:hypothetical protein Sru01_16580 [Sphaerisporangium rufum]|uniref:Subtilisin inhibitor domain-containing protein n=1 Tax=Sphaerisporangium rufum TaxID=1381558 RepID=A0A919UX56_9ACTN|nr:SSI family serine proteinase inhibitor [Sphaerisporangium rufum]GII76676.1 hypothetical protein Sru01_16580 [Sphaerisporangium rufum]